MPLKVLRIYEKQFTPEEVKELHELFPKTRLIMDSSIRKADVTLFAPLH